MIQYLWPVERVNIEDGRGQLTEDEWRRGLSNGQEHAISTTRKSRQAPPRQSQHDDDDSHIDIIPQPDGTSLPLSPLQPPLSSWDLATHNGQMNPSSRPPGESSRNLIER